MVVGSHEQPQPEDALIEQDQQTDNHDLHRRGGSNGWITLPLDLREDVHRQAGLLRPRQEERQVDIGERDDESENRAGQEAPGDYRSTSMTASGRGRVKTLKGEDRAALFSLFSFSDSGHQWV